LWWLGCGGWGLGCEGFCVGRLFSTTSGPAGLGRRTSLSIDRMELTWLWRKRRSTRGADRWTWGTTRARSSPARLDAVRRRADRDECDGKPERAGDVPAQLALGLDNPEAVLGDAGVSVANLIRLDVYSTDVDLLFQDHGCMHRPWMLPSWRRRPRCSGRTRLAIPFCWSNSKGNRRMSSVLATKVYSTDVDLLVQHCGMLASRLGVARASPTSMLGGTRLAIPTLLVELEGTAVG
jgi:hypothetical protein